MNIFFNYKIYVLFVLIVTTINSTAQVVTMSNSNVNDCDFTLYDTGGVNASGYSSNQDFTMTICPDAPNKGVVLTWFTFNLEHGDYMEIFDGNSINSPPLGSGYYTWDDLDNISSYATINNPSGCLTLHFVANDSANGVFNAAVKCETPCAYPNAGVSIPTSPLQKICLGETLNFDGANSSAQPGFNLQNYSWDFGDGTNQSGASITASHTFNNTGRYIVRLDVTDNNGCKNKNAAFTEVIVESIPEIIVSDTSICQGQEFCFKGSATSPPLPPPVTNVFGQGIHIPDDVGSCFESTQFFDVFPVGERLANIADLSSVYANMGHTYIGDLIISVICPSGQSVTLHQQGGGGANLNGDYYWSPTTGNPTWAGSGAGGTLPPGTYSSVQSLNGLVGCELNGTWTLKICDMWAQDEGDVFAWGVNINPSLYVDLEALSPSIGNGADSSYLSGPGFTSLATNGNQACALQTNVGNSQYTYTVKNSFGCTHSKNFTATIKPSPKVDFNFDSICIETEANFTNQTTGNGPFTYSWNYGDGSANDNNTNGAHFYNAVGTYNVLLSADAGNGCVDDSTKIIEIYAEPLANFNVLDDCLYNMPEFTNQSTVSNGTIDTWQWNFGVTQPSSIIDSTSTNPSYIYSLDGSYDVTLIVETDKGCNDTIVKTTTRHPIPQVDFSTANDCEYDSIIVQNLTQINNPDEITSWIWNFGDGTPFYSDSAQKHLYAQEGDYTISLIATSNNGCIDDTSHVVTVYPKPIANFSNTTECENFGSTSFSNLSTVITGSIMNWHWNFDDMSGETSYLPNPFHNYQEDGIYDVQLIITTDFGCLDTIENAVTVLAKPTNDFVATIIEECYPYCTDFSDLSISNASSTVLTYWEFESEGDSYISSNTICFENLNHVNTAFYDVTLITQNDLGCYDTLVKEDYITVWPKPLASFIALPNQINMYESEIEFENNSEGNLLNDWNFGDGHLSSEIEPINLYSDTGHFNVNLIITTEYGCKDTTNAPVIIDPVLNVYIPNTFTPNGDGDNDDFFINGFAIVLDNFEFRIFDRWGTLIYFTDEFRPWDGTYKGQDSQQDVYSYIVNLKDVFGEEHSYKGHVNLLR